jgi:hypothetical protein
MLGAIPPLPQYVFMAWCLVKDRDNLKIKYFYSKVESSVTIIHYNTVFILYHDPDP